MCPALTSTSQRILALDASGLTWSAALLENGRCVAERQGGDSRTATAALPAEVQGLLGGQTFAAVAVSVGPGSFTGLRGALAFAHGLAVGAGVPVIGVTVAEALTESVGDWGGPVWIALDARRAGRVFLGRDGGMEAVSLDALPMPSAPVLVLGDASAAVCAMLTAAGAEARAGVYNPALASAIGHVGLRRLAGQLPPCEPQPLYVEAPAARLP